MARARNIKPGFFMNEDLTDLPFEYRLLFIGLWTLADREGKLEDRPKRIKMELFPADNVDVDQGLSDLERYGFVERYEVNGVRIVMILKFTEHQRPHHTEKASELPNKDGSFPVAEPKKEKPSTYDDRNDNGELTVKGALDDGGNPPDSLNPDSLIPESNTTNPIGLVAASEAADQPAKPAKPDCPHQKIIDLYHELLPASPEIREWTPSRAVHLRTRWNESPGRQNLDWWRRFFGYIAKSEFLTGRAHSRDRKPFCAPLDWICKAENFAKIIEGRYHEETSA